MILLKRRGGEYPERAKVHRRCGAHANTSAYTLDGVEYRPR